MASMALLARPPARALALGWRLSGAFARSGRSGLGVHACASNYGLVFVAYSSSDVALMSNVRDATQHRATPSLARPAMTSPPAPSSRTIVVHSTSTVAFGSGGHITTFGCLNG
jgi:hypothetical protein